MLQTQLLFYNIDGCNIIKIILNSNNNIFQIGKNINIWAYVCNVKKIKGVGQRIQAREGVAKTFAVWLRFQGGFTPPLSLCTFSMYSIYYVYTVYVWYEIFFIEIAAKRKQKKTFKIVWFVFELKQKTISNLSICFTGTAHIHMYTNWFVCFVK